MTIANTFNNRALKNKSDKSSVIKSNWCNIQSIAEQQQLPQQYADICQQYDLDNKWILMINPDNEPLQLLSTQGKIDPRKILKVNIHQRSISLNTIEHALEKGHCSAVILCNVTLKKSQVLQLTHYAEKGQTKCIILTTEVLQRKSLPIQATRQQAKNAYKHSLLKSHIATNHLPTQLH
jgi:cell division inhibitor SulA